MLNLKKIVLSNTKMIRFKNLIRYVKIMPKGELLSSLTKIYPVLPSICKILSMNFEKCKVNKANSWISKVNKN